MSRLLFLLICLLWAGPAAADPISALVSTIAAFVGGQVTLATIASGLLRSLVKAAISLVIAKIQQRKQKQPGIQSSHTTSGGTEPQASILGRFATKGHLVYQNSSEENNKWLIHVIELGDIPGATLRRLILDGEYAELGAPLANGLQPIQSKTDGGIVYGYIRYFDGSQTAANADLVTRFGADADRPWTADHILTQTCYATLYFHRNDRLYPGGVPKYAFEMDGPPLYDPRKDSTAGGSGAHRFGDPATWEQTANLMVIAYNVLRGITLPDGRIWGGAAQEAEDLPYAEWAAAMDACDLGVGAENRPQFTGGFEVRFEDAPADFLEELFASANAQIVEMGGYWFPLVGAAATSSAEISGDDLLVSDAWQHDPFPGLESTFNGVTITHTSPAALWEAATLETLVMEDWVAEDGRQKLFELSLPMVSSAEQARQLANALLQENRRFRTHRLPLPGEYARLRPLQTVTLTLADYGYVSKTFRITEVAYDLLTLNVSFSLRETDPADFAPDLDLELPEAPQPTGPIVAIDAGVVGFTVTGVTVTNGSGQPRAPAIRITWNPGLAETCEGLSFQIRVVEQTETATVSTSDVAEGVYLHQPVLPNTTYELRAKAIARRRQTEWSGWLVVSTPDVRITPDLLDDTVWEAIEGAATADVLEIVNVAIAPTEASILTAMEGLELRALGQLQGNLIAYQMGQQARRELAYVAQDVRAEISADRVASAAISTALGARIDDAEATLLDEVSVRASETEALSLAITATQAQLTNAEGELDAATTAIDAVTSRVTQAEDDIDAISQAVTATQAALDDAEDDIAAQASTLSQHTSRLTTAEGQISAQAQSLNSVSTTVGQHTAAIDEVATSIDGLRAEYVLRVSAGGVIGGMILGADAGDSGAPTVDVTFAASSFKIAAPNGAQAAVVFGAYTSARTIDGIYFPAGVYLENAYIGRAMVGRGQITDVLQSDNYAEGANGRPTAGLKLNFETGEVKAAGLVISRPMVLAQGTLSVSGTYGNGAKWLWVNTGIRVGANDVWQANRVALVAFAAVTNGAIGGGALDPNNTFWSVDAKIQPGARWNGFGGANPAPAALWSQDPATLVNPWWATATDQRLYLALSIEAMGDVTFQNPVIAWKVFEVT